MTDDGKYNKQEIVKICEDISKCLVGKSFNNSMHAVSLLLAEGIFRTFKEDGEEKINNINYFFDTLKYATMDRYYYLESIVDKEERVEKNVENE